MTVITLDLENIVNQPIDSGSFSKAMGISEGPWDVQEHYPWYKYALAEQLLGGVMYQTESSSALATYAYRFVTAEDGQMLMVVFNNPDTVRIGRGKTSDPIKLGSRVVVFEKSFPGGIRSHIYDMGILS